MLKGNLMKLNRAMKASPTRMKSVSFDRTLRWQFIVRGTEVDEGSSRSADLTVVGHGA
jgi:hypothetical protein